MYELSWYAVLYIAFIATPLLVLFTWFAFARSERSGGMATLVGTISFALMIIMPNAAFLANDGNEGAVWFAILAAIGVVVSGGLTWLLTRADERSDDRARPGASHIHQH